MDNSTTTQRDYTISEIKRNELFSVIKFVIMMNYAHHQCSITEEQSKKTIEEILQQESKIFNRSHFYKAVDENNQMIGTLRIADWDKSDALKWINGLQIENINKVYHIGRFAVSQSKDNNPLGGKNIFRQLMLIAFSYICENPQNILIAECDMKLFSTLRKLGIELNPVGDVEFCLGSDTICAYATYDTIRKFYDKYKNNNSNK